MIHQYHVSGVEGLVVERFIGRTGIGDLLNAAAEVEADPEFRMGMRYLVDARDASTSLAVEDVRRFAEFIHRSDEGARAAVVVAGALEYGIVRMLAALAEGKSLQEMQVFRDPVQAADWLGVGEEALAAVPWW